MKRVIPIIAIVLHTCIFCMAAQEQIYTIQDGKIISSPNFVKQLDDADYDASSYEMEDRIHQVQVGSNVYGIRVGDYTPKICEGDFNLIEVYSEQMERKLYKDNYGILKMNNRSSMWYPEAFMANYTLSELSKNGYFIEVSLTETSKAIIFIGQSYGTDVGKTFIFVLTESDAELVFNLPMSIEAFIHSNNHTEIIVQSDYGTPLSYDTWSTPTMHTIYTQDGMLMFKKNER